MGTAQSLRGGPPPPLKISGAGQHATGPPPGQVRPLRPNRKRPPCSSARVPNALPTGASLVTNVIPVSFGSPNDGCPIIPKLPILPATDDNNTPRAGTITRCASNLRAHRSTARRSVPPYSTVQVVPDRNNEARSPGPLLAEAAANCWLT